MIHGNPQRFAVEWELDPDPMGMWLIGRCCFWAGGLRIGNYKMAATLSDVLGCLMYPVGDCGKRQSERLCRLTGEAAFSMLHWGLFECEPSLSHMVNEESWARFDVSVDVDVFHGWKLYLIDCEERARLLIGRRPPTEDHYHFLKEQPLAVGEYDRIICEFQRTLEATWEHYRALG